MSLESEIFWNSNASAHDAWYPSASFFKNFLQYTFTGAVLGVITGLLSFLCFDFILAPFCGFVVLSMTQLVSFGVVGGVLIGAGGFLIFSMLSKLGKRCQSHRNEHSGSQDEYADLIEDESQIKQSTTSKKIGAILGVALLYPVLAGVASAVGALTLGMTLPVTGCVAVGAALGMAMLSCVAVLFILLQQAVVMWKKQAQQQQWQQISLEEPLSLCDGDMVNNNSRVAL